MIDYSQLPLSKGKTRAELKATRDALRKKVDRAENLKVIARSWGRCEVVVMFHGVSQRMRCRNPGSQPHHMIYGHGKRARGESLLAEHKQWVCETCHPKLTEHKLRRVGGETPYYTDYYEVVK